MEEHKEAQEKQAETGEKSVVIFFIVALIIIAVIAGIFIYKQTSSSFNYNGLYVEKTKTGSITFYDVSLPALDEYGKVVSYSTVKLRNDPRDLENVKVSTNGSIRFVSSKKVYISIDKDMPSCNGSSILSMAGLGMFLSKFGLDNAGALNDPSYEGTNGSIKYANCEKYPDNSVIMVFQGNKTAVTQTAKNCYEIEFKDCESLMAVEKFQVQMMEEYIQQFS
jgi:hypothetical protein